MRGFTRRVGFRALPALILWVAGCAGGPVPAGGPDPDPLPDRVRPDVEEPVVVTVEPMLPDVQVEQVAGGRGMEQGPLGVPVEELVPERVEVVGDAGRRTVTLTAVGTEIRSLLVALAEAAGVDLVVDPAVGGRVTVHFQDVPAREALEQVIRETGHMIARPLTAPFPATVYYVVPVNVNEADAETIRARFDVSAELARFLIRSRIPQR